MNNPKHKLVDLLLHFDPHNNTCIFENSHHAYGSSYGVADCHSKKVGILNQRTKLGIHSTCKTQERFSSIATL